ncbi:MaoC family dehydratase [Pseudonocardia lacus]|uniref:MaoC family dehydratase n=1 Tax=Pseudonocardia lacus TaxID=2835865 RepID=UPI001BDC5D09|nr:MaoC family dehydratase [Pseudonocardia lacus]
MRAGDALPPLTVTVEPAALRTMAALLRDPNPIHLDPAASAALGFGRRLVVQGPITLGYVQTMLVAFAGGADRVLGTRARFVGAVYAGERVVAGGQVTEVRADGVECAVWLDVERPAEVVRALDGTARIASPDRPVRP